MTIGIYGGTFDPLHIGHLITAERTLEILSLDRLLIIPAFIPPHKQNNTITPFHHRLEMARRATANNEAFEVSDIESRLGGVSYSLTTLTALKDENPPETEFFLIIGADSLLELHTWHQPERLVDVCRLAVLPRHHCDISEVAQPYLKNYVLLDTPVIEIASSALRKRIRAGQSVRYLVPDPVLDYIHTHGLYQHVP